MHKRVIIVGYFQELVELCERLGVEIIGAFDNNIEEKKYNGVRILGKDSNAKDLFVEFGNIPLILSPDLPEVRKKLADHYGSIGFEFETIVSPDAYISSSARLGKGIFVQSGVNVSSNSMIGDFVRLNTNANVMHDNRIDSFVTIAPNAVLLGKVTVNTLAYIGSNATILPGCQVGENSIVGAGSVITKNVDKEIIVAGNPAKFLRKK